MTGVPKVSCFHLAGDLILVFSRYRYLLVLDADRLVLHLSDVVRVHEKGSVGTHELFSQSVLPLGDRGLVAVCGSVGCMDIDIAVIGFDIDDVIHIQRHLVPVRDEGNSLRDFLLEPGQEPLHQHVSSGN